MNPIEEIAHRSSEASFYEMLADLIIYTEEE